jgi:hypothetical protein
MGLRKKTIELVKDGEKVLAKLSIDDQHKQDSDLKPWMCELRNETDLRKILKSMRKKLSIYLDYAQRYIPISDRKRRTPKKGKSPRQLRKETFKKFEKVESQLKSIMNQLSDFHNRKKKKRTPKKRGFIKKPSQKQLEMDSSSKMQRRPVIKPEICINHFKQSQFRKRFQ